MCNLSALIEQEVKRIGKNGEITKAISQKLQFIDSTRFIASSLSNLVKNLAGGSHKIECKYEHNGKKIRNLQN